MLVVAGLDTAIREGVFFAYTLGGIAVPSEFDFAFDPVLLTLILVVILGLLVLYFVLLVRALIEMLRLEAPSVMVVFTYISLIPFPLLLILGILNLIIWHFVRKDLIAARGSDA